MNKVNTISYPENTGMVFKILIVAAIVILFGLFLYTLLGPLPSQSNFVKKGPISQENLKELYVVGTSTLNGNVLANSDLNITGNETVEGKLTVHDMDFIIGNNVKQGSIIPNSGGLELRGNGYINIEDLNGINTTAEFNTGTKETNFNGLVTINNSGTSGLVLKNQTGNRKYTLKTNSFNDFTIERGEVVNRSIIKAEETGFKMTLLDESAISPLLYINGTRGVGRVYDSEYNPPPGVGSTNPTLVGLTVNGTTRLNGTTTITNWPLNVNGADINVNQGDINTTGGIYMSATYAGIKFTTTNLSASNGMYFSGDQDTATTRQRFVGYPRGDIVLNTFKRFQIQNYTEDGGAISFDTRPIYTSGTKTVAQRNAFVEPFVNINNGYMKISLPIYGVNPIEGPGGQGANQTVNIFSYTSTDVSSKSSGLFPSGTPLGLWDTSNPTGNGTYVQSRMSSYNSVTNAQWTCPKKGIWSIDFNSKKTSSNNSFVIGNLETGQVYGTDFVSTFAVIDILENVVITSLSGSGSAGTLPTLVFKLIMELN